MKFLQDPIILTLAILLALTVILLIQSRRWAGVWLLAFTIILFVLPRAGILVSHMSLPLPLAHVLAVLLILQWLLWGPKQYRPQTRFGYYFLIYAAIAGFGAALGMSTGGDHTMALLELFIYLVSMGLFFYASETFSERQHFILFAKLILCFSFLISIYGIAQKSMGSSILVDHVTYNSATDVARSYIDLGGAGAAQRRVLSSYGDPNVLACQLLVFCGIALALIVGRGISAGVRLLCLGILIVNIWCVYYTGSRAGIIVLVVVGLIVLSWRTRWFLLALPALVLLIYIFGYNLLEEVLFTKLQALNYSDDLRAQFPAMTWQLLKKIPLGCGLGNMVTIDVENFQLGFAVTPASNVWSGFNSFWLNLLSRLGIPGLVGFMILLVIMFRYLWNQTRKIDNPLVRAIIIGGLAGCVGQTLIWLVNNTYMLPGGSLNFWFMMGMMVAGSRAFATETVPYMLPVQRTWPVGQPVSFPT